MTLIKALPEFLINQIAAGEVVERPASVVKELVENGLDAGARHITVEVEGGGDTFLRITDDGSGMDAKDALLAFERHATSKISTTEDLFNIHTLGFRGEALASIASVSYMMLQTKQQGRMEGTLVSTEGGKMMKVKSVGVPEGTQIEVRQLFYNTPARKKYLKNPHTEFDHIANVVAGMALAFPGVGFKLIHDQKVVFDFPPVAEAFERIRALLGKTVADELIPVFYGHSQIQLTGYIGKPLIARSNRNLQYLFVNNREVRSHVLSYAAKQSFHSLIPKEKYPVFLFYFQIDPELVDVNVHPRKSEVRFKDEKEIFSIVTQACKKSLENHVLMPKVDGNAAVNYYTDRQQQPLELKDAGSQKYGSVGTPVGVIATAPTEFKRPTSPEIQDAMQFNPEVNDHSNLRAQTQEITPLAQLDRSYILCQQGTSLLIIDQHAAHERIRYTELMVQMKTEEKSIQPLLDPFQIELSYAEARVLQHHVELLKNLGFEIESFGGNTFSIHAIPANLQKLDLQKVLHGLIDELTKHEHRDTTALRERSLTYLACRSAVKFGDPLAPEEQRALIEKLVTLDLPYTCPHGRPTMITMSAEELKKRFGREYV